MKTIFLSAGHGNVQGKDQGAVGNGYIEGQETLVFRDLVACNLDRMGATVVVDVNSMVTGAMVPYFKTKLSKYPEGIILMDIHFNAAIPKVSGTECVVRAKPTEVEKSIGMAISKATADILKIPNRPLKTETQSHRGKLYLFQNISETEAIVVLQEVCFISNANDMKSYAENKDTLAMAVAKTLFEFAN